MPSQIAPQPGIMDIALYQSGASHVEGQTNILKLSSNENPHGPSDAAKEAIRRAVHEMHRYPSTDHTSLRTAIGEVWGVDPDRVICGVGSDEIIHFLCQCYAGPGDEVIHTEHGFAMYRISTLAAGATPVQVPERDRVTDVDAILAACTDKTKLVFIANPNNPTSTMIGEGELARLADGLPPQAILVLDGAYAEFVDGYDAGVALIEDRKNVVMTRTFSKIYGLPATTICAAKASSCARSVAITCPTACGSPWGMRRPAAALFTRLANSKGSADGRDLQSHRPDRFGPDRGIHVSGIPACRVDG